MVFPPKGMFSLSPNLNTAFSLEDFSLCNKKGHSKLSLNVEDKLSLRFRGKTTETPLFALDGLVLSDANREELTQLLKLIHSPTGLGNSHPAIQRLGKGFGSTAYRIHLKQPLVVPGFGPLSTIILKRDTRQNVLDGDRLDYENESKILGKVPKERRSQRLIGRLHIGDQYYLLSTEVHGTVMKRTDLTLSDAQWKSLMEEMVGLDKAGILHRDLHHGNVMVQPDGLGFLDFEHALLFSPSLFNSDNRHNITHTLMPQFPVFLNSQNFAVDNVLTTLSKWYPHRWLPQARATRGRELFVKYLQQSVPYFEERAHYLATYYTKYAKEAQKQWQSFMLAEFNDRQDVPLDCRAQFFRELGSDPASIRKALQDPKVFQSAMEDALALEGLKAKLYGDPTPDFIDLEATYLDMLYANKRVFTSSSKHDFKNGFYWDVQTLSDAAQYRQEARACLDSLAEKKDIYSQNFRAFLMLRLKSVDYLLKEKLGPWTEGAMLWRFVGPYTMYEMPLPLIDKPEVGVSPVQVLPSERIMTRFLQEAVRWVNTKIPGTSVWLASLASRHELVPENVPVSIEAKRIYTKLKSMVDGVVFENKTPDLSQWFTVSDLKKLEGYLDEVMRYHPVLDPLLEPSEYHYVNPARLIRSAR